MKFRIFRIVVLTAVVLAIFWFAEKSGQRPPPSETPSGAPAKIPETLPENPSGANPSAPAPSAESTPVSPVPQKPSSAPAPPPARRDLGNPLVPPSFPENPVTSAADADPAAAADLDKVSLMLRDYRTLMGENPVGTNAEIMKALMGDNPRGAKLGPPEGMQLNGNGELVDAWGTPIFFHQLSKDLMEIISAGPDQRMGTEDDLKLK